jgi:hypothetical protein
MMTIDRVLDEPTVNFAEQKSEADRIINIYASAGIEALWAYNKGNGFWIRGIGYINISQAVDETAEILRIQSEPQRLITLKVNDESASYDQTWKTIIVHREDDQCWHGRPFHSPNGYAISWPKSAWMIVVPETGDKQ